MVHAGWFEAVEMAARPRTADEAAMGASMTGVHNKTNKAKEVAMGPVKAMEVPAGTNEGIHVTARLDDAVETLGRPSLRRPWSNGAVAVVKVRA